MLRGAAERLRGVAALKPPVAISTRDASSDQQEMKAALKSSHASGWYTWASGAHARSAGVGASLSISTARRRIHSCLMSEGWG